MKRSICLLLIVFGSTLLLFAQSEDHSQNNAAGGVEMTGQVCRSTCVTTDAGKSVCDASCKDKSGDMVFVDDNGKLWKIHNPTSVKKEMMGKKIKASGKMTDGDAFDIEHIALTNGPG